MGWAVGYDPNHKRDIGYGVPAICDYPGCKAEIHRGLAYVCGGDVYGGDDGCGLFFCYAHLAYYGRDNDRSPQLCERCGEEKPHFDPKPDTEEWVRWKLTDPSWADWRGENPDFVAKNPMTPTPQDRPVNSGDL